MNIILFKVHRWRDGCVQRFLKLCQDLENHPNYKVYALCDNTEEPLPKELENHPSVVCMDRDNPLSLCKDNRYWPKSCRRCDDPIKSATRSLLPLLAFSKDNEADFYWQVEYDVIFTGDWYDFFRSFEDSKADLLASYISKEELFAAAKTLELSGVFDENTIKYTALHCICRVSKRLVEGLLDGYKQGMYGHYEAVVPTRCVQLFGEESLEDISAKPFCKEENFNRFYTPRLLKDHLLVQDYGFSGRNQCIDMLDMQPNKLYHAVK